MHSKIPGAYKAAVPSAGYRLRQIEASAQASRQVVDLLLGLACGDQPERALTRYSVPAWAASAMGVAAHG